MKKTMLFLIASLTIVAEDNFIHDVDKVKGVFLYPSSPTVKVKKIEKDKKIKNSKGARTIRKQKRIFSIVFFNETFLYGNKWYKKGDKFLGRYRILDVDPYNRCFSYKVAKKIKKRCFKPKNFF